MRIFVAGATGLIGSAAVAKLTAAGHEVIAAVHRPDRAARRLAAARTVTIDFAGMTDAAAWQPHLAGVDAVLNCVGLLQGQGTSLRGLHTDAAGALFAACEQLGIRRVVHLSAIGVDRETPSDFSRTKIAADTALMARDLDWVILRPSVAVGEAAYGASALFRALAVLPIAPVFRDAGPVQVLQLDEVIDTIAIMLSPEVPARVALELVGPERLRLEEIVRAYRRWFGLRDAPALTIPAWLFDLGSRLGDFAGLLGWRPPVRTNGRLELRRGAIGDPGEWMRRTGIRPRRLSEALAARPASVQERWFSLLYLLKPVVFTVFAAFWILTGIVSLGPGFEIGERLMEKAGLAAVAGPGIVAGALADILVGIAIALRRTARLGLYAALAVSVLYLIAGTLLMPGLWADPIGPLLKIWPVLALNLIALAILDDR